MNHLNEMVLLNTHKIYLVLRNKRIYISFNPLAFRCSTAQRDEIEMGL